MTPITQKLLTTNDITILCNTRLKDNSEAVQYDLSYADYYFYHSFHRACCWLNIGLTCMPAKSMVVKMQDYIYIHIVHSSI